uniref:DUF1985 domain-containing protein n=1 Tax=Aegilops tauschii subsp. strangulata TaxID=200361 RepID=A0A453B6P0_AEGTS
MAALVPVDVESMNCDAELALAPNGPTEPDIPEFVLHPSVGRIPKTGHSVLKSSFAPKDIAIAVAKWGESPKKQTREMGLGGLLHVDHFTHFSRNHSLFCLQSIDTRRKRLVLGKNKFAQISERSMSAILGTREGGGVEIQRVREGPTTKEIFMVRKMLDLDLNHQEVKTPDLLKVLCEDHPEEFTKTRAIRLKLALAMLVLSVFYSPRDKRGYVPKDAYLLAYAPENLDKLNWTKYGVAELLDAAARVQQYVNANPGPGLTIFGCHYYLQVLVFLFLVLLLLFRSAFYSHKPLC